MRRRTFPRRPGHANRRTLHSVLGRGILLSSVAALATGCGTESRLRDEQRAVVPASFELVECEFASGLFGLVSPPASYCVYLVRGTKEAAADALAASLERRGYEVSREPYGDAIELKGHGRDLKVRSRIGKRSVGPHLVPDPLPVGYVAASVTVGEPEP